MPPILNSKWRGRIFHTMVMTFVPSPILMFEIQIRIGQSQHSPRFGLPIVNCLFGRGGPFRLVSFFEQVWVDHLFKRGRDRVTGRSADLPISVRVDSRSVGLPFPINISGRSADLPFSIRVDHYLFVSGGEWGMSVTGNNREFFLPFTVRFEYECIGCSFTSTYARRHLYYITDSV